jgi:hypothetical protein
MHAAYAFIQQQRQQVDAFFCFNALLTRHLPRYVTPTLDGVHTGCALIGRVLQVHMHLFTLHLTP